MHYELRSGRFVELPLVYKNWKAMTATFTVPAREVEALLPPKLKPILLTPTKALISFSAFEYPEVSDLAPYNEFGVTIPVEYSPSLRFPFLPLLFNPLFSQTAYSKAGNYVYYLPVTTEESHAAGSEIWGFPKVVRHMKFSETEEKKTCALLDRAGREEIYLEVGKFPLGSERSFAFNSYTEKDGKLLLTKMHAKGRIAIKEMNIKASIRLGEGDKIRPLKHLHIGKNPVQVFWGEILESELPEAGEKFVK